MLAPVLRPRAVGDVRLPRPQHLSPHRLLQQVLHGARRLRAWADRRQATVSIHAPAWGATTKRSNSTASCLFRVISTVANVESTINIYKEQNFGIFGAYMNRLHFKNLQKTSPSTDVINSNFVYTDIAMDIRKQEHVDTFGVVYQGRNYSGKDLAVSHDEEAIATELYTLFSTRPGQRLLIPTYGCDLRRFIGEPINGDTAYSISSEIQRSISAWVSRVVLKNVIVEPKIDNNEYYIKISIDIPKLGRPNVSLFTKFSKFGNFSRVKGY